MHLFITILLASKTIRVPSITMLLFKKNEKLKTYSYPRNSNIL